MTTTEDLIAVIVANPDEDTPRLMYADWIQERESSTPEPCPSCSGYADDPCPRCGGKKLGGCGCGRFMYSCDELNIRCDRPADCHECKGTGKFPPGYCPARDPGSGRHEGAWTNCSRCNGSVCQTPGFVCKSNGLTERAELIRVQVELANRPFGWGLCGPHEKHTPECVGNKERLAACNAHGHRGDRLRDREKELIAARPEWRPKCPACVHRMSPDGPNCGAGNCAHCRNNTTSQPGRIGTLERGFLHSVTVPRLADVLISGPIEGGGAVPESRWNDPSPWAHELIRDFPTVERVVCQDQIPHESTEYGKASWYENDTPAVLFERLGKEWRPQRYGIVPERWVRFQTRDDAVDAMGECVTLVLKELLKGEEK